MQQPPNYPNDGSWQQPQQPNTQYPQQWQQPQYPPPPPNTYYPPEQWQQPPMMPPPPPPRPPKRRRNPWLIVGIVVGAIILFSAIGNAVTKSSPSNSTTQTTAIPTDTPTDTPLPTFGITPVPTDTPAPPPKWMTTQTFSGTGDKQTGVFTVPDDWKIIWSCDATHNYGVDGVFFVYVYNSDGTPTDNGSADSTCAANKVTTDSTEEHQSGSIYLKVGSSVPWKIQIQEFE